MKEARSVVNAVFAFLVFLMTYGFFVSGHVRGTPDSPRFLRMEIEEDSRHGKGEKISFSMPYSFYRGGIKMAASGRLRRELDTHFSDSIEAEQIKGIWNELREKPEGTPVTREHEGAKLDFVLNGETIVFTATQNLLHEEGSQEEKKPEIVTIQFPKSLLARLVSEEDAFDIDTLLRELPKVSKGEVLKVESQEGRVRVWIE